jgi:peroxiredoxin
MPRIASIAAAALALATAPLSAALPVGAAAPNIETQASLDGKAMPFSLKAALKKGPVVLYFYPAAFTPGCTIEAHLFADATDDFKKLGATVIGMSADPIDKLNKFSTQDCRSKFAVGMASMDTITAYDVSIPKTTISNRTSYVIAPDGKIIFMHSDHAPEGHVTGSMAAVREWRAKHPA